MEKEEGVGRGDVGRAAWTRAVDWMLEVIFSPFQLSKEFLKCAMHVYHLHHGASCSSGTKKVGDANLSLLC